VLRRLSTLAISRGLFGGSKPWLVIGGAIGVIRFLQWAAGTQEQTVYAEELQPGETLVISREPAKGRS
jgi:hypothetical protein